jgi:hypothetical protein
MSGIVAALPTPRPCLVSVEHLTVAKAYELMQMDDVVTVDAQAKGISEIEGVTKAVTKAVCLGAGEEKWVLAGPASCRGIIVA